MTSRTPLLLIALGALYMAACASAPQATEDMAPAASDVAPAPVVQYLQGQVITTSPDGVTPFGPPVTVLARRVLDPANGQIVEDSWHGADHYRAVLTRRPGTLIFDGVDDKKTFEGTLTFDSEDLLRGGITYAISMTDQSGTLAGTGVWEGDTYHTNKVLSDPTGTPRVKVSETLTLITEEAFLAAMPK